MYKIMGKTTINFILFHRNMINLSTSDLLCVRHFQMNLNWTIILYSLILCVFLFSDVTLTYERRLRPWTKKNTNNDDALTYMQLLK